MAEAPVDPRREDLRERAPTLPWAPGELVAGCRLLGGVRDGALACYQAEEVALRRACEVIVFAHERPQAAHLLHRARRLAASGLPGLQPIYRVEEEGDHTVLVVKRWRAAPLARSLRTAALPLVFAWIDELLAALALAQRLQLPLPSLRDAGIVERHVGWPLAALLVAGAPRSWRQELAELLAAVVERPGVPAAVLAVCEALDRDRFTDLEQLRRALRAAERSWWRRWRGALVAVAAGGLISLGRGAVARDQAVTNMIREDLPARVEQMRALERASAVVPHGEGPELGGVWVGAEQLDGPPVSLRAVGARARGQWRYASEPLGPAGWRHAGVLTLRRWRGRWFLVGSIDRTPERPDDDSFAMVEFEVLDREHLLLRSSVFHDPEPVGWSFAYFEQPLVRAPVSVASPAPAIRLPIGGLGSHAPR
ncbi:MAG: hypothetical protein R3B48_05125 [Kofleriaceae bacterium]